MKIDSKKLIKEGFKAQKLAYIPYSNFPVGAALLLKNGKIIHGANIENAAYGVTMCAERNAVYSAICQGYKKEDIVAISITANCKPVASPCGACRQVLFELLNKGTPIYLTNHLGESVETTPQKLLPIGFGKENLDNAK
jgi:cytidine deaminase